MQKTPTLLMFGLLASALGVFLASCGDESTEPTSGAALDEPSFSEPSEPSEVSEELRRLEESPTAGLPVYGLESGRTTGTPSAANPPIKTPEASLTKQPGDSPVLDEDEANAVFEKINQSNLEQEVEIAKLKSMVAAKDKRIHEYRLLKNAVEEQNKQLRQAFAANEVSPSAATAPDFADSLKRKHAKLKNDYAMRTKDWHDSQERVRILEDKIKQMEAHFRGGDFNPLITESMSGSPQATVDTAIESSLGDSAKLLPESPVNEPPFVPTDIGTVTVGGTGRLEFQAAVTQTSGKTREALYTEFFITKSHLDDILRKTKPAIGLPEGIVSYSELWARVRKNEFRYPGLQRKIRDALLTAVAADGRNHGRRIRTDVDGSSPAIDGLAPGNYFIIGTAPLGQVGVTWSLPVEIEASSDKRVALTLNNSSWSL